MKPDPNKEIDQLLRRQARRAEPPAASDASGPGEGGMHLAADELNAFAENALPAAARARYSAHLADCDSCRSLVTQLVLASGLAGQLEKEAAVQPAATPAGQPARSWLATFFAPRVLRYAASIVLLIGVSAVAFMVFRGQPMRFEPGTQNTQSPPTRENDGGQLTKDIRPDEGGSSNPPVTPPAAAVSPQPGVIGAAPSDTQDRSAQNSNLEPAKTVQEAQRENNYTLDGTSGEGAKIARDEVGPKAANQPAPPPPAPAQMAEVDKNKQEGADADTTTTVVTSGKDDRSAEEAGALSSKSGASAGSSRAQAGRRDEQPSTRKRAASRVAKESAPTVEMDDRAEREAKAKPAEETRRAGGRQFVRRGNAWVDTAYQSQATTVVRRGSEQYRALIADEPGLRTIADQLGGEVVVVWKGRAYRIR